MAIVPFVPRLREVNFGSLVSKLMRILHIIDNLNLGGSQLLAARVMSASQFAGYDVGLVVLTNFPQQHIEETLPDFVRQFDFDGDYRRWGALRRWSRELESIIKNFQPDLLHSWLWLSDMVAGLAGGRMKLPHVAHLVDRRAWLESQAWKHKYRRWITQRVYHRSDARFLAVSQAVAEHASRHLSIDLQRINVAWNSIDVEPFAEIPSSNAWEVDRPLILGIAARIEPEKGHRFLLEALSVLRGLKVPVRLRVTGEGSAKPALVEEVDRRGLGDCVEFTGWIKSVREFLQSIDVFVVPSIDSEGLPTTILEAMAAERLVIATDVGGAREAVRNDFEGWIVPPRDGNGLAAALLRAHQHRQLAGSLARQARGRVRKLFHMPRMMETIFELYGRIGLKEKVLV